MVPCDYGSTLSRIMLGNGCQDVGGRVARLVVAVSPGSSTQAELHYPSRPIGAVRRAWRTAKNNDLGKGFSGAS
jgi:hypothetical protein